MINADRANIKTAAVYKIVWLKDKLNRVYIGQTKNLHRRMADYKTTCKSLKNMKNAHASWLLHICKTENVGSLDFDKDFEVTVLEFVDDVEGADLKGKLNQLEIKYISEYHSYDPTFKHGFNFTRGGAGDYWSRKGKRNVYLRTANNRAIVRNTLIVFDIETCSYRQFLSFTAAEAALGVSVASLKHSYYEPVLCGKKYVVLSADPEKRRRYYDRCLCRRFDLYHKYPESDHSTRALVLRESMKITSRFAMAEDAIYNNNDVNIACFYETVYMLYSVLAAQVTESLKYISKLDDRYSGIEVLLYDTYTKEIMSAGAAEIADHLGLKLKRLSYYIRFGKRVWNRFYVFYGDDDIRKAVSNMIATSTKSDGTPLTAEEQSEKWNYVVAYHIVNKERRAFQPKVRLFI